MLLRKQEVVQDGVLLDRRSGEFSRSSSSLDCVSFTFCAIALNIRERVAMQCGSRCRCLISSRAMRISVAANTGLLEIFVIEACFPAHLSIDTKDSLTLIATLIFEAQWLHRFPLLQFLLQDSARKTNPSQGLLVLSSNTP